MFLEWFNNLLFNINLQRVIRFLFQTNSVMTMMTENRSLLYVKVETRHRQNRHRQNRILRHNNSLLKIPSCDK